MGRGRDGQACQMMTKITELHRDVRHNEGMMHGAGQSAWVRTVAHGGCAGCIWGGWRTCMGAMMGPGHVSGARGACLGHGAWARCVEGARRVQKGPGAWIVRTMGAI